MNADRVNAIREAASNIDASARDNDRAAACALTVDSRAAFAVDAAEN